MARRNKNVDYIGKLSEIDSEIQKLNEKISQLQEQRKTILEEKKQSEIQKLYTFINNSGKSIDDFISEQSA